MKKNEGTLDRILRVIGGVAALTGTAFVAGPVKIALVAVGCVLLVTAAVGFCPLYRLFGLSTCRRG